MNMRTISALAATGPNCVAGKTSDLASMKPEDFRRRLLAWAEILESELVRDHWDYGTFGSSACHYLSADSDEASVNCGTTACAAGWLFLVPEASRLGIGARFKIGEPVFKVLGGSEDDADEVVSQWLGLDSRELSAIMYASSDSLKHLGKPPHVLTMAAPKHGGSSPADVAKVIRWIADVKYPSKTIAEIVAEGTNGNFAACVAGDHNEKTPEAYRRRLLAWAELLESKFVDEHWSYEAWGKVNGNEVAYCSKMAKPNDSANDCGTTACAGGWMYLIPEASRAGALAGYGWSNTNDCTGCADRPASEFFGMPSTAMYGLTRANNNALIEDIAEEAFAGLKPLRMVSVKEGGSTPKDVAAYIRRIADALYPVDEPCPDTVREEPAVVEPESKPKRVERKGTKASGNSPRTERKGTKRHLAKLFRDGAAFLETHNHTIGVLYQPGTECFCAMGAVAAVYTGDFAPSDKKLSDKYRDALNELFGVPADGGSMWFDAHWRAIGENIIKAASQAVFGKQRGTVWETNDDFIPGYSGRATKPEDKAKIVKFMRLIAYMLEHGGKLPKSYAGKVAV